MFVFCPLTVFSDSQSDKRRIYESGFIQMFQKCMQISAYLIIPCSYLHNTKFQKACNALWLINWVSMVIYINLNNMYIYKS